MLTSIRGAWRGLGEGRSDPPPHFGAAMISYNLHIKNEITSSPPPPPYFYGTMLLKIELKIEIKLITYSISVFVIYFALIRFFGWFKKRIAQF